MNLSTGQQIGVYRIIRPLGQGGVGTVYEVEHTQLGVHYALKTFTFDGGHGNLLKDKFLIEGKVLARLHNPYLVRVFDLNFDGATGTPYFVMDLVLTKDGQPHTLADIKTVELDEDRILQWFAELATAIDYIHAQGIVHRDIKLGNVLLSTEGYVVLSDFGISRLFSERLRSDVNALNTIVTEVTAGAGSRLAMGTHGYMAPEVERGEAATPAADVYSLGVMFVYLLSGIWYEPGSKVFKLLESLEYRWIEVLPRLLAENPQERPSNLTDLVAEIRQTAAPAKVAVLPGRSSRPPKMWIALALAGIVALTAVGIFAFLHYANSSTASAESDELDLTFGPQGIYSTPNR